MLFEKYVFNLIKYVMILKYVNNNGRKREGVWNKRWYMKKKIYKYNYWENGVYLDIRKFDRENGGC